MRFLLAVLLAFTACRKNPAKPAPPPSVNIRRTSPIIGERFIYTVNEHLRIVLTDGTNTVDLAEETTSEAEETITRVENNIVMERDIRFMAFHHLPLGAKEPVGTSLVGRTVRWPNAEIPSGELVALKAYVRNDTGQPDLATFLLTERDFTQGVAWEIPADQPAPFARGLHAGASITLTAIEGTQVRFAIQQVRILEPAGQKVPITLNGTVVMDIGHARILSIDIEGHITAPSGPVVEAHMTSRQTFTYPR